MRGVMGWLGQLGAWLIILAVAAVLAAAVVVPRAGGATPYAVETGSMRPSYPPGTLVVAKPTSFEDIAIGDVVTYQLHSGEPTVVTHRVIATKTEPDGSKVLIMQGDANDVPDENPVREVQVKGTLWYAVPHLGRVNGLLSGGQRQTAVYGVALALLGYAAFMFLTSVRDRRRTRSPDHVPVEHQISA
jgi:signal peptidase